ncbi:MAG: glycosyltransferase family 4 protein [Acidobacteriaceae bacterium]|nr:glycosyltransferase family 4 protein [Acidobacteriaceae bacterium]
MKIFHVISSGGMYGAEAVILNLSHALNERSHQSVVGVFANSSKLNLSLHHRAKSEGLESHAIPCMGRLDRSAIAGVRELALSTGADIVHAHGFKADIYAWCALRRSAVPLVSTCHTWYDLDPVVSFYGKVDRLILRRYDAVVAVSDVAKERLLSAGVDGRKVRIIRNGIDPRPFASARPSLRKGARGEGDPVVGFAGRLSQEKGCDLFVRAAVRVLASVPNAKFIMAGDGPEREALERLIDHLGARGSVSLVGRRDDMPSVYASFDIAVLPSRDEGLPIAVLEGMASGLPWVAAAVSEVPKIITDGESGLLVPAEDVEALAAKIVALLNNAEERCRLGEGARRRVEKEFSVDRMVSEYLDVYQQVLDNKNKVVN